MATLISNAGVKRYANKMVLAENRKVGSKSLPTALNDIDNLIDEMKTHFDAEYGSALDMKLNNNENIFSVGTGTNVDKRSEVENSFTDVELSGNSLVAIFNFSYTTTNEVTTSYYHIGTYEPNLQLKDDVYYTLLPMNPLEYVYSVAFYNKIDGEFGIGGLKTSNKPLLFKKNTNITTDILFRVYLHGNNTTIPAKTTFNFLVLEGDWTNKPIPQYFEGMKSVGQDDVNGHKIEILSRSKNLLDESFYKVNSYYTPSNTSANESTKSYVYSKVIKLKPKTKYTLTHLGGIEVPPNKYYRFGITDYDKKEENVYCMPFSLNNTSSTDVAISTKTSNIFTTNESGLVCIRCYNNSSLKELLDNSMNKFVLLEGTETSNGYLKGELNKKEILLNEPLRGLPNGIKDTIEKVNGEWKIVRRCGEEALTNNTTIEEQGWSNQIITKTFAFTPSNFKGSWTSIVPICNTFITGTAGGTNGGYSNDIEGCFCDTGSIVFRIDRTKLVTEDVLGFKEWLSQNPTKVIYELGTPIIEDISPLTMQCWKNGTISIDEVLPVETTHTVALNKPAQIKRNIEELTALRNKVQALEEQYDKIALEQAYQLSLINHSIELDYNI